MRASHHESVFQYSLLSGKPIIATISLTYNLWCHFFIALKTDILSLNSFHNEQEELLAGRSEQFNKTANHIIKIKNPECDLIANVDYNPSEKKLHRIFKHSSKKTSPLHIACSKGDLENVKKLIQKENANVMKQDPSGLFPLHTAIINNKADCVKLLLNNFACSPNVMDKTKMTGLHHACLFGYVDIVRILIDHPDIDMISKNLEGKTCLDICQTVNSPSAITCAEIISTRLNQPVSRTICLLLSHLFSVFIHQYFLKPPKINIKLMDGSEMDLQLVSGSNTTVEQLQNQIYNVSGNSTNTPHE